MSQKTILNKKRTFKRINYEGTTKARFYGVGTELRIDLHEPNDSKRSIDLRIVTVPYLTLSICGNVGATAFGQCSETIRRLYPLCQPDDPALVDLCEICDLWDRWHLNDMNAGTRTQRAAIWGAKEQWTRTLAMLNLEAGKDGTPHSPFGSDHYGWATSILDKLGLLHDQGYKYGEKWLVELVPAEIIIRACKLHEASDEQMERVYDALEQTGWERPVVTTPAVALLELMTAVKEIKES